MLISESVMMHTSKRNKPSLVQTAHIYSTFKAEGSINKNRYNTANAQLLMSHNRIKEGKGIFNLRREIYGESTEKR